jgi:hypothetical protein
MLDEPQASRQLVELRLAVDAAMQRGRQIETAQVQDLVGEFVSRQRKDIVSEKQPAGSQREDSAYLLARRFPVSAIDDPLGETQRALRLSHLPARVRPPSWRATSAAAFCTTPSSNKTQPYQTDQCTSSSPDRSFAMKVSASSQ